MAVIQDTYLDNPARGYAGMPADGETTNVISRTCADVAGIAFGKPVFRGASARLCSGVPGLTATAAALGTNTGNGTFGTITVGNPARAGVYTLRIVEPGSNVGTFVVEDPAGVQIGDGVVGTAFAAGGLSFTLADGATDFVAGDSFAITVAGGELLGIAITDHGIQPLPGGVAADIYPQYASVGIKTGGSICVEAGGTVAAGDLVTFNGTDYLATGGALLPGWEFDEAGVDGSIVKIVRR
jgi:hypothetical protein